MNLKVGIIDTKTEETKMNSSKKKKMMIKNSQKRIDKIGVRRIITTPTTKFDWQ